MKKIFVMLLCACFVAAASGPAGAYSGSRGKEGRYGRGLSKRYSGHAGLILRNAETLGLDSSQTERIRERTYEAKRDRIRARADMKLIGADIAQELGKDETSVEKVESLIDRKYRVKADMQKNRARVYLETKDLLTAEQKETLRSLRRGRKQASLRKPRISTGKYSACGKI